MCKVFAVHVGIPEFKYSVPAYKAKHFQFKYWGGEIEKLWVVCSASVANH